MSKGSFHLPDLIIIGDISKYIFYFNIKIKGTGKIPILGHHCSTTSYDELDKFATHEIIAGILVESD